MNQQEFKIDITLFLNNKAMEWNKWFDDDTTRNMVKKYFLEDLDTCMKDKEDSEQEGLYWLNEFLNTHVWRVNKWFQTEKLYKWLCETIVNDYHKYESIRRKTKRTI